ncbi:MAG TPA: homoserine dehydrogenase [Luteimonas sp.]|jgi:homoserine dehydrogenase|nr:homoserine dehydrogenase [Luteimonas sp.]
MSAAKLALIGTGNVGRAVLARLAHWDGRGPGERLRLAAVANTRSLRIFAGSGAALSARDGDQAQAAVRALGGRGLRIAIDATASDALAARHAEWLASGIHVVTACKLGQGASLARWMEIRDAAARGGACYGDSATVGAGLPLLRTIRALRAGGDRIHGIAGVLSGSLAWLLSRCDGRRPFAELVDEARALGYTEPDPRQDLSGEDVRRKLLILARAAGVALEPDAVAVRPLDAAALAEAQAHAQAQAGGVLRYVARLECGGDARSRARVGLEVLPAGDPLAAGTGTDNRVAIHSDRYPAQPLLIQGPGAGAEVTAAALLDDALRIAGEASAYAAVVVPRASAARYAGSGCGWSMA